MADPAVSAIEKLQAEFPERTIRLVLCPELLGTNGKVSNLVQMLGSAQYDYILINDSDIKVSPHYLRRIMGCFHAPQASRRPCRHGDRPLPAARRTAPTRLAHGSAGHCHRLHRRRADRAPN